MGKFKKCPEWVKKCFEKIKKWGWIAIVASILFIFTSSAVWVAFSDGFLDCVSCLLGIEGENTKYRTLQTLGWIIGGLVLFLQAIFSGQRAKAMNETAQAHVESNHQKLFKEAISHLGSESSSVRLGGIYALHGLAKKEKIYLKPVFEIFNDHVRETTQGEKYKDKYKDKDSPSNEIQRLLNLLTKKPECNIFLEENLKIDFRGAFLKKADLDKAQLQGADLEGAQLQGADLEGAQLQGAYLYRAQLQEANLEGAQLQGAILVKAQLQGAYLSVAQLQGAKLREAQLQGAYLSVAQLQGAKLRGAQLQGADLEGAQLQGAKLREAQLQGAYLYRAQLQGVGSDWTIEDSFEERIQKSTGKDTNVKKTIFSGGLTQENFNSIQIEFKNSEHLKGKGSFIEQLKKHICEPIDNSPPQNAVTGILTQDMANKIIKDYKKSLENKK